MARTSCIQQDMMPALLSTNILSWISLVKQQLQW